MSMSTIPLPKPQLSPWHRWIFIGLGGLGLFFTYLFQQYLNVYALLTDLPFETIHYSSDYRPVEALPFIINKASRYLLNDGFAMFLVYGLFYQRLYLRFAFFVFLFGLGLLMPLYLVLYLSAPEGFSSMLGHLHRLIFNPVLMMLLIPAFYYQRANQPG